MKILVCVYMLLTSGCAMMAMDSSDSSAIARLKLRASCSIAIKTAIKPIPTPEFGTNLQPEQRQPERFIPWWHQFEIQSGEEGSPLSTSPCYR